MIRPNLFFFREKKTLIFIQKTGVCGSAETWSKPVRPPVILEVTSGNTFLKTLFLSESECNFFTSCPTEILWCANSPVENTDPQIYHRQSPNSLSIQRKPIFENFLYFLKMCFSRNWSTIFYKDSNTLESRLVEQTAQCHAQPICSMGFLPFKTLESMKKSIKKRISSVKLFFSSQSSFSNKT